MKKRHGKGRVSYPIDPEVLELLRSRKIELGINIGRSIDHMLSFAMDHKEEWWNVLPSVSTDGAR